MGLGMGLGLGSGLGSGMGLGSHRAGVEQPPCLHRRRARQLLTIVERRVKHGRLVGVRGRVRVRGRGRGRARVRARVRAGSTVIGL